MAITKAKTATKDKETTAKGKKRQRDPKLRVDRVQKAPRIGTDAAVPKQAAEIEVKNPLAPKGILKTSTKGKKAELQKADDEGEDSGDEDEEAARAASKAVLKSLGDVSAEEDVEDDDSEAEDEEDDEGVGRDAPFVDVVKLPSSKDDKAVKARLDAVEKKRQKQGGTKPDKRGVLYVGRIPKGFYEEEMKSYFSQFGIVTRLRLSRNKKTGAPKHYGFIEFEDEEVAQIVQETMDNYLIMGHLLQVKTIPKDKVHPDLLKGANRKWRKMPSDRRERVLHDQPRTEAEQKKVEGKLLRRQHARQKMLKKKGIDYDFPGYQATK